MRITVPNLVEIGDFPIFQDGGHHFGLDLGNSDIKCLVAKKVPMRVTTSNFVKIAETVGEI